MSMHPLAVFLDALATTGGLVRVDAPVDPKLEVAEITRRVVSSSGPALFFDQLSGKSIALVTNLLGTESRLCQALDVGSLAELGERMKRPLTTASSWFERLRGGDSRELDKLRPRTVKTGDSQQVVRLGRDIDLGQLPAIQCWPEESGPQLTGRLISADEQGKSRGVELCRLQVIDNARAAIIADGQEIFARHWNTFRERGERMPLAVVLGGQPAETLAAWVNLCDELDGYTMAGLLLSGTLDLVKCRTHALEVPADADLILEGYLDLSDEPVCPLSSALATGHYAVPSPAPVLHVTAITSRTNPVIPAIVPGSGGELAVLHKARERILLPLVKAAIPELVEYSLPAWGGVERFAFISIQKTYPCQAQKVASALWGLAPLRDTKVVAVVDADVDVHDYPQVLAALGANVHPGRDVFFHPGPAHLSDHSAPHPLIGHAIGIDATAKLAAEHGKPWPERLAMSQDVAELVSRRWIEYGVGDQESGIKSQESGIRNRGSGKQL